MKILQIWPSHSNSSWNTSFFLSRALRKAGVKTADFAYSQEIILQNLAINAFRGTKDKAYEGEAILLANRMMMGYVASALPDAIIVVTGLTMHKGTWQWLEDLRRQLRHPYKIILVYTESPYRPSEELELAQHADYIFTNERAFVGRLRQFQPRSWYMPQAYDEEIHAPAAREQRYATYFCGSGFRTRIQVLEQIDWERAGGLTLKGLWRDIEEGSPLKPYYQEGLVQNEQVVEDYRASGICLNLHRREGEIVVFERDLPNSYSLERGVFKTADAESMNNRACEIAATGAFQIADDSRAELGEVFGDSVPQFSVDEPAELQELVEFYTQRPQIRAKLAEDARMRIQGRTYLENVKRILSLMED